jgi:hypothetical protein
VLGVTGFTTCYTTFERTTEARSSFWPPTDVPKQVLKPRGSPSALLPENSDVPGVLLFPEERNEDTEMQRRIWTSGLAKFPEVITIKYGLLCPTIILHSCLLAIKPQHKRTSFSITLGLHF